MDKAKLKEFKDEKRDLDKRLKNLIAKSKKIEEELDTIFERREYVITVIIAHS